MLAFHGDLQVISTISPGPTSFLTLCESAETILLPLSYQYSSTLSRAMEPAVVFLTFRTVTISLAMRFDVPRITSIVAVPLCGFAQPVVGSGFAGVVGAA